VAEAVLALSEEFLATDENQIHTDKYRDEECNPVI
jgi:hypothetical protein